jgi:hypothetical protein
MAIHGLGGRGTGLTAHTTTGLTKLITLADCSRAR